MLLLQAFRGDVGIEFSFLKKLTLFGEVEDINAWILKSSVATQSKMSTNQFAQNKYA